MATVEMVLVTPVLMLCLVPLVVVYGGFTVIESRVTGFGSTTDFAELSVHEMQKMDLIMTVTPVLPTILVGCFWHSRFCYDLLMAPIVFPYQEVFRWIWFIFLVISVCMITMIERKTRRSVMNRTIGEAGRGKEQQAP